jgi:8-amino-7-oxononanoate synthase
LLIDYLVNACGGFLFSTAPPPAMLGAIDAALDLVPGMDVERATLVGHATLLRQRLNAAGIDTGESSTQIVPVIVGEADKAVALSEALVAEGMLAAPIRPPTVPQGTSRLRIALRATHSSADIEQLAHFLVGNSR